MDIQQYQNMHIAKISNLYQDILNVQAELQQSDAQNYYTSRNLKPLDVNCWNAITEKAVVFGLWQILHAFVPQQTDEYISYLLIDTHIIEDIEPLEQQYLAALHHPNTCEYEKLKQIGNVLDAHAPLGEFWQRNEWVSVQFGYAMYENIIHQYVEFLRACWHFTKVLCKNSCRANIEAYLSKVFNSIISRNELYIQNCTDDAYKILCEDVKASYKLCNIGDTELIWTPACKKEINLWTYWQGMNVRHPKILLVGQDWGCPDNFPKTIANIDTINQGAARKYFAPNEAFCTDTHLAELFKEIGYDDIINTQYDDLFFTNLVLGYRTHGSSGDCKPEWIEHDLNYFYRLVHILQPKVILCLGRITFEGVLKAFHEENPIARESYNHFIEGRVVPEIKIFDRQTIPVFPLAHCGSYGSMNRNAASGRSRDDLQKQREDWQYINNYL